MIRFTKAMCFTLATVGLFLNSPTTYGQFAPQHSVVDHYQNLFHARSAGTGLNAGIGQLQNRSYLPTNNFGTPTAIYNQPSYLSSTGFDVDNAFGQKTPPLSQTLQMPRVDHSRLVHLINLGRNELFRLHQSGMTPSMQEMDGLWYGFNTGRIPETLGFSQFIKDLRTNSPHPTGTNILVHQLNPSQLNNGYGWRPKFDLVTGGFDREGQFVVIPPDGVGQFGHAAKGIYALGGNATNYPGNRIRTRIVKLDHEFLLGQSTLRVGNRYIHSGFFVLQRMPPTAWNQR